jgi:hypothetical protein
MLYYIVAVQQFLENVCSTTMLECNPQSRERVSVGLGAEQPGTPDKTLYSTVQYTSYKIFH